jgi:hypothetical protein
MVSKTFAKRALQWCTFHNSLILISFISCTLFVLIFHHLM